MNTSSVLTQSKGRYIGENLLHSHGDSNLALSKIIYITSAHRKHTSSAALGIFRSAYTMHVLFSITQTPVSETVQHVSVNFHLCRDYNPVHNAEVTWTPYQTPPHRPAGRRRRLFAAVSAAGPHWPVRQGRRGASAGGTPCWWQAEITAADTPAAAAAARGLPRAAPPPRSSVTRPGPSPPPGPAAGVLAPIWRRVARLSRP